MTNPHLPLLLDGALRPLATLEPVGLSLEMNLSTLSTAVMTLPTGQTVEVGQFVRLFTPQGSAGIFRAEQVEQAECARVSLTHGLVTLEDGLFHLEQDAALPASRLFAEILSRQQRWQPGTLALENDPLITCQAGATTLLEALQALMDALPGYRLAFDQDADPWRLHVLPLSRENPCECRLTRNLQSLTIETDRSALCTRLYLPGLAEPLEADTLARWGAVTRRLEADEGLTEEELRQLGRQYLAQHQEPRVSVTLDAIDLSRLTGSPLDSLRLGAPCRVCLPETAAPIAQRVVTLAWPQLLSAPDQVRLTLANQAKTAASLLAGLIIAGTQVRRQVTRQGNALSRQQELLLQAEDSITLLSRNIDIHAQEMLTLRAGVDDNAASITLANGRIDQQANEITLQGKKLVSLQSGVDDNAASITLANGRIDQQANEITLHGNKLVSLQSGVDDNAASITLANGRIDQQANEITLQGKKLVSLQSGVDDNAASITLTNGRIDQQAKEIALKADKITLNGYVKMTSFEAEISDIKDGYSEHFTTDLIDAGNIMVEGTLNGGYVTAENLTVSDSMTLDGKEVATQEWVSSNYQSKSSMNEYAMKSWVANAYLSKDLASSTYATSASLSSYQPKSDMSNYAMKSWVANAYATKASLSDYQLKSGLTTKTIKPVTSISVSTGTTPAFYQGNTQIAGSMKFVTSVSANTTEYTVVVYA